MEKTMIEQEINWKQFDEDAAASISTSQYGQSQKTIFLKVQQGMHKIRLLPVGNKLDNLPYMRTVQHNVATYVEGKQRVVFGLCWTYLYECLLAKKTNDERRDNTIIGYLIKQGKLADAELKKYQEHGCPFCKAFEKMDLYGVEKETKNKFLKREQFLWNVVYRTYQGNGDNQIYVWGCSKTQFNKVVGFIRTYKELGKSLLSMSNGYDIMMQATGEKLLRRYDVNVYPQEVPVDIGQNIPYDLAELVSAGFKTYDEMCGMLRQGGATVLDAIGYSIPGYNPVYIPPANGEVKQLKNDPPFVPDPPKPEVKEFAGKPEVVEIQGTLYQKLSDGTLKPLF